MTAIGQQGRNRPANIVRQASAAQGGVIGNHRIHIGVIAHRAAAEVGGNRARCQGVHGNTPWAQFFSLVARQDFHRAFHRCVGGIPRQAEARQAAGDIDDAPAIADQRQQFLREEKRCLHMDRHQLVELGFGGFGKACVGANPGVVDQEVEMLLGEHILEQCADLANECIEGCALADVQLQHGGATAQGLYLGNHGLGFGRCAVVSADDVDALRSQVQGGAFAQATAGASDECDFTGHGAVLEWGEWD